jgi:hypothetical protein
LISSSDKLLTITTQLVSPQKIKLFDIVVDKKLNVSNLFGEDVYMLVDNE